MKLLWFTVIAFCWLLVEGQNNNRGMNNYWRHSTRGSQGASADNPNRNQGMRPYWRESSRDPQGNGYYTTRGTAGGQRTSQNRQHHANSEEGPQCTEAGFFANEESCEKFYRCVDWNGDGSRFSIFHFDCPAGTVFDPALSVCNFRYAANRPECLDSISQGGSTSNTGHSETEIEGPSVPINPETDVQKPNMENVPEHTSDESKESTPPKEPEDELESKETEDNIENDSQDSEIIYITTSPIKKPNNSSHEEKVFSLSCYEDGLVRQHPLYCNMYYYCIYEEYWQLNIKICPENLIFNESKGNCSEPDTAESFECRKSPYTSPPAEESTTTSPTTASNESDSEETTTISGLESTTTDIPEEITTSQPELTTLEAESTTIDGPTTTTADDLAETTTIDELEQGTTTEKLNDFDGEELETTTFADPTTTTTYEEMTTGNVTVHTESFYDCPEAGYYPYEEDCIHFYKCVETDDGQLLGLFYRCPEGYGYSEEKKRCFPLSELPTCEKESLVRLSPAVEATTLTPLDLQWFFN